MALTFKTTVANFAALPTLSNVDGDLRYVADSGLCYRWSADSSTWIAYTTVPTLSTIDTINLVGALPAAVGAGDITSVVAGTGLTGGATSGAATLNVDVGTTASKIVQLNGSAQLPAVSGALLTNLNGSAVASGTVATARLDAGTGANQLVQRGASGEYPAGDGAAITALSSSALTGALPAISGAALTALNGSNVASGTVATARLDAGTGANQLVQRDSSGNYPAGDGAAVSGVVHYKELTWDFAVQGGTGTVTMSGGQVPANSAVSRFVITRVTTVTGTGASISFAIGAGNPDAGGFVTTRADLTGALGQNTMEGALGFYVAAATDLTMTIGSGSLTAGKVRFHVYYTTVTP